MTWEGWTFTLVWMAVSAGAIPWLIRRHHPGWIVPWALSMVAVLVIVLLAKGYPTDGPA